ncbi:hypothetical protein FB45DRAFT_711947, partial [Roridomyces roridus]
LLEENPNVMATCARQHAHLLQSLEVLKRILSPVRRLPNELLVEIFTVMVRDGFDKKHFEHPWVPSRVCRRWSAVALGTPSLWSFIPLDLNVLGFAPGAVALTKLQHERSRNSPLSVRIVA